MSDRLSALDASFLYLEEATTPMHVGAVSLFRRPRSGFDYDRLVELVEQRIGLVPRYRQKVREVPGWFARPVWIDDVDFDITYHVRRSALPKPGSEGQLLELAARLMSRPLDHTRPLWEMTLVEGLSRNRFAVVTKSHQAMVDGIGAVDIGQVILDVSATPRTMPEDLWMPRPEPSGAELVLGAVSEVVARPGEIVDNTRTAVLGGLATVRRVTGALGGVADAVRTAARPSPGGPLNVPISTQRRLALARTRLDDHRAVRRAHGCDINDVVLAVVTGALRNWLLSRGEVVTSSTMIRAMAPQSVRGRHDEGSMLGNRVGSYLVDLPVGEPNPVLRLQHVSHAMRAHKESGQSVGAEALVRLSGFAPPTMHSLGARVASGFSQRIFNLVITNVPGPQFSLYTAGAKLLEMFPVVPLAKNQAVAVGITSYDGGIYYGVNADRDAMSDVGVLAALLEESLDELVTTVTA
ncbi:MAG: wax ester/triacylglycerol synthase family O-acyltransferase [Actinomycetota bacterium]|nr:wax ester/triacylglycerol synthase family O-acyltransferase [Actinomycetota bacterium]